MSAFRYAIGFTVLAMALTLPGRLTVAAAAAPGAPVAAGPPSRPAETIPAAEESRSMLKE